MTTFKMTIVAVALSAGGVLMAQQKPVVQGVTSVSHAAPPTTLADLVADSHAIVVVKVTDQKGLEIADVPGRILTEVTGQIVDVIKPSSLVGPPGSSISFRISGGEIDRGDHIERIVDPGQPKMEKGGVYLIALKWSERDVCFYPSYGPHAIFNVSDGTVRSQSDTTLARTINGMSLTHVVGQLKAAAVRK